MQNNSTNPSELALLSEGELQQTTGGYDDVLVPVHIYLPRPFPIIKFPPIRLPLPLPIDPGTLL